MGLQHVGRTRKTTSRNSRSRSRHRGRPRTLENSSSIHRRFGPEIHGRRLAPSIGGHRAEGGSPERACPGTALPCSSWCAHIGSDLPRRRRIGKALEVPLRESGREEVDVVTSTGAIRRCDDASLDGRMPAAARRVATRVRACGPSAGTGVERAGTSSNVSRPANTALRADLPMEVEGVHEPEPATLLEGKLTEQELATAVGGAL